MKNTLMHSWGNRGLSHNMFRIASVGVQPDLAVLDCIVGMQNDWPVSVTSAVHSVALASNDWLTVDRLAVELMDID